MSVKLLLLLLLLLLIVLLLLLLVVLLLLRPWLLLRLHWLMFLRWRQLLLLLITLTLIAFIRYIVCSAMQRHYSDAVMPVLGLQHAAQDATRSRLQRCIANVGGGHVFCYLLCCV